MNAMQVAGETAGQSRGLKHSSLSVAERSAKSHFAPLSAGSLTALWVMEETVKKKD